MVRKERGVTITSLTIYIIVSVIVLAALAFLNINVISQIADLSKESEKTNKTLKAEVFLVGDIKSASRVLDFSKTHFRLDNNVEYTVKQNIDSNSETTYELYRGKISIVDKMAEIAFDYGGSGDDEWLIIKIDDGNDMSGDLVLKVGRGY